MDITVTISPGAHANPASAKRSICGARMAPIRAENEQNPILGFINRTDRPVYIHLIPDPNPVDRITVG